MDTRCSPSPSLPSLVETDFLVSSTIESSVEALSMQALSEALEGPFNDPKLVAGFWLS